jgi:Na+-driven multidrug efflux pump
MRDALTYLKLTSLFYPALAMLFIHRNVLQGIGRSFMPLMAGVFELVARAVIAFVLPGMIGYVGVCLAGPAAWVAAAVPLAISYVVIIKQVERQYEVKKAET